MPNLINYLILISFPSKPDDGKFEYCGIGLHKPPMCFLCRENTACYKCKECGHIIFCKTCFPEWSANCKRRDKIKKKFWDS
jgi:hypothetical protein